MGTPLFTLMWYMGCRLYFEENDSYKRTSQIWNYKHQTSMWRRASLNNLEDSNHKTAIYPAGKFHVMKVTYQVTNNATVCSTAQTPKAAPQPRNIAPSMWGESRISLAKASNVESVSKATRHHVIFIKCTPYGSHAEFTYHLTGTSAVTICYAKKYTIGPRCCWMYFMASSA